MKIAIYGDSFAYNIQSNSTKSWVDLLSNLYDVTCFARTGSSLYFSVEKFLATHNQFDKIIFLASMPGRLYLENEPPIIDTTSLAGKKFIEDNIHIGGLSRAESKLKQYQPMIDSDQIKPHSAIYHEIQVFKAVVGYFLYLKNTKFDQYVHNLMIDNILSIRSDIILVPTSTNSIWFYKGKNVMMDIWEKENIAWDWKPAGAGFFNEDTRHCHMTAENNKIFFEDVIKWLDGSPVNIDVENYIQPRVEDKDLYFINSFQ